MQLPINVDNEMTEKLYKTGYRTDTLDDIDEKFPELLEKIRSQEITQQQFNDSASAAALKEKLENNGYPPALIELLRMPHFLFLLFQKKKKKKCTCVFSFIHLLNQSIEQQQQKKNTEDVADTEGIDELEPIATEFREVMLGHRKQIRGTLTLATVSLILIFVCLPKS